MSQEITDKTFILVTRNLGKIWLTESEAMQIKGMITGGKESIIFGGNLIMKHDICGVVTGEHIADLNHEKRGDWKCKHDQWHTRGQTCGHGLLDR